MELLPSQHNELAELVSTSSVSSDVYPDYREAVVWRYRLAPNRYAFVIVEQSQMQVAGRVRGYRVTIAPGRERQEETFWMQEWSGVKELFLIWLQNLDRERRASDLAADSADAPDWLASKQPRRAAEIREQIAALRAESRNLGRVVALLWQTGQPLNEAVRDVFRSFGFSAELTPPGATYDVTVDLGNSRRLLIEVTGIDDIVRKHSNKIPQVLQTTTREANERDRVVLAVNAHRRTVPEKRGDLLTPDAANLLFGRRQDGYALRTLGAVVGRCGARKSEG